MQKFKNIRNSLGPLFLILVCPAFAMLVWYTNAALGGSLSQLWAIMQQQGIFSTVVMVWQPVFFGSFTAWVIIISFVVFELILVRLLPGQTFYAPITPQGNVPVYKANGVSAFLVTVLTFSVLSFGLELFPATIIYDHFGEMLGALNLFSLLFCVFLYFKGRFAPSTTDASTTGNVIFDYYWGTELYPSLFGWHIKMFIACRIGMMSWGLILLSYAAKQQALFGLSNSMIIALLLQFFYLSKFYVWETGY